MQVARSMLEQWERAANSEMDDNTSASALSDGREAEAEEN